MKELLRDWLLVNENRELRTVYTRISTFILYRNKKYCKETPGSSSHSTSFNLYFPSEVFNANWSEQSTPWFELGLNKKCDNLSLARVCQSKLR